MQPDNSLALPSGATVSNGIHTYRIVRLIGASAYSFVYEAVDDNNQCVALKECFLSCCCDRSASEAVRQNAGKKRFAKALADFHRASEVLFSLQGINGVVGIINTFETNATAYCVMQMINGPTLTEYVRRHGPLPQQRIVNIVSRLAATIAEIHSRRTCHLDIQPDNIMLQNNTPTLIDFGQACRFAPATRDRILLQGCSDGYAPPEQYREITRFAPAADIYALGAVTLFSITAKTPDRYFSKSLIPDSIPNEIADEITRAMHPDPAKRRPPFCPESPYTKTSGKNQDRSSSTTNTLWHHLKNLLK